MHLSISFVSRYSTVYSFLPKQNWWVFLKEKKKKEVF